MTDITELQALLDSVGREGKLIDRYIDSLRKAGEFDGVTKAEALSATQRFAALVEQSAKGELDQ